MIVRKVGLAGMLAVMVAAVWFQPGTATATVRTDEPIIITGEVVRLEPGKLIVIRSAGKETTYMLSPNFIVPAEIQVGRPASLQLELGPGQTQVVKTVTTTIGPGGTTETTEVTREEVGSGMMVTGTVETYLPGKSVTVLDRKGARVTYVLTPDTSLPAEMIMGKNITVYVAKGQPRAVYFLERDGDKVRLKVKKVD
jgi:hypothetical protein